MSKRLKESAEKGSSKATPTKSKYFEEPDSEDVDDEPEDDDDAEESGYEDEDPSATDQPSGSEPETEDDYDFEADRKNRKPRKKAAIGTGTQSLVNAVLEKGKELWRPGVKTGLGPGKQVFIEKPKPRGDGGIKYVPEKIHPNTMAFLMDLKNNNDREWLKSEYFPINTTWRMNVLNEAWETFHTFNSSTDRLSL